MSSARRRQYPGNPHGVQAGSGRAVCNRGGEKQFPPGPQVFVGADASIAIPALGIDLRLRDIYSGIDFD
jgi:hypothetical protein